MAKLPKLRKFLQKIEATGSILMVVEHKDDKVVSAQQTIFPMSSL